ncbi:MAG: ECF transporter S component [Candidatus Bathyarchaeia archaeon]
MNNPDRRISPKTIAFVITMGGLANILALVAIPIGITSIHLIQLPIILTGLVLGPLAGGLVGFVGAVTMAFTLLKPNPYILLGNAILGGLTGLFYRYLGKRGWRPIIPQTVSVLIAYAVQMPYVYVTDIYLMGMPQPIVLVIILKLLLEDLVSVFISHVILYRLELSKIL